MNSINYSRSNIKIGEEYDRNDARLVKRKSTQYHESSKPVWGSENPASCSVSFS